jgi:tRNA-dihydrouridine synthase
MIGRGVFGNPWFFSSSQSSQRDSLTKDSMSKSLFGIEEKLKVLIEHTQIFDKKLLIPKHKNFATMKKHFKAYVNGFEGAKELRVELMETENSKQVEKIINDFLKKMR